MKTYPIQSITIYPNFPNTPHAEIIGKENFQMATFFGGEAGTNFNDQLKNAKMGEGAKIPLFNHPKCNLFLLIPPKKNREDKMTLLCNSQIIEYSKKEARRIQNEIKSSSNEEIIIFNQDKNPNLKTAPHFKKPYTKQEKR